MQILNNCYYSPTCWRRYTHVPYKRQQRLDLWQRKAKLGYCLYMAQATKILGIKGIEKLIIKLQYHELGWPMGAGSAILLSKVKMFESKFRKERLPNSIYMYQGAGNIYPERHFLTELSGKIQLRKHQVKRIEAHMVQNYSPSSKCADALLKFKDGRREEDIEFCLKIDFANFYRHWEKQNRNSLKRLVKNGVALKLIQGEDDWTAFSDDEEFVKLAEHEKAKLLQRAKSTARMKNEKQGMKISNHFGLGNIFQALGE